CGGGSCCCEGEEGMGGGRGGGVQTCALPLSAAGVEHVEPPLPRGFDHLLGAERRGDGRIRAGGAARRALLQRRQLPRGAPRPPPIGRGSCRERGRGPGAGRTLETEDAERRGW